MRAYLRYGSASQWETVRDCTHWLLGQGTVYVFVCVCVRVCVCERDRERYRQTERERERERETYRHTDRQTYRQTNIKTIHFCGRGRERGEGVTYEAKMFVRDFFIFFPDDFVILSSWAGYSKNHVSTNTPRGRQADDKMDNVLDRIWSHLALASTPTRRMHMHRPTERFSEGVCAPSPHPELSLGRVDEHHIILFLRPPAKTVFVL